MNKINILGQDYDVRIDDTLNNTKNDGECLMYDKLIRLRNKDGMLEYDASEKAKNDCFDETLRHEIIHAFFFEAGLSEYCNDEMLVDFIAKQFPKILQVFKEAGAI